MKWRTEQDTLGEIKVPAESLYGAQTQRAVENFPISGLRLPRRFIRAQGVIKLAAAQANAKLRCLDKRLADAIIRAAEEVVDGLHDDQFVVDVFQAGAGTSQNMNANEVIANRANQLLAPSGETNTRCHPNDHVNMAQSTNDTIPTAIHIAAAEALRLDLLPALRRLQKRLEQKARLFMPVVKSGRTHLQDAVPMRLGQEFAAWASAAQRDQQRLQQVLQTLLELPLGGNAVGTGINAHPRYAIEAVRNVARLTKMQFRPMQNLFEGIQNSVGALELSAALRGLAVNLGRLANDIRLLASGPRTGLAEIELPAVQPGSSIMPGKVNPVMAEMLNMACYQVIGNDAAIMAAAQGGQLELNVMMPVMAHNLLGSLGVLTSAVNAFEAKCLRGLKANRTNCRKWLEQNLSIVTALNPVVGYHEAARLAQKAARKNLTIYQVVVEEKILSPEKAAELLNPEKLA